MLKNLTRLSVMCLVLLTQFSCVSHKELINFNEVNFPSTPEEIMNMMEIRIQEEDLLRITVHSVNPEAAAPFNIEPQDQQGGNQNMMVQNTQNLELFSGYFVDREGYIDFPVLGRLEVEGMTIPEAKNKIVDLLKPYLNDAVVNMRFLNFKVTVLGEVEQPGTIRLTNKRITLLEAIGMTGDLTDYANRNNILVIREKAGAREYARLDLQSSEIFTSPYFYLQQNDVIYIEPLEVRTATVADPASRFISYGSAFLSIITLVVALVAN